MTLEHSAFHIDGYEVRASGDGRTIDVLAVPFDAPTNIGRYVETFKRGSFSKTIADGKPERVKLFAQHEDQKALPLGAAKRLEERSDGLHGSFRISRTRAGDEVLALIEDGALDSVSIGFIPVRSDWTQDRKAVQRREVKLMEVSLVAYPAYQEAKVLALREQQEPGTCGMSLDTARRLAQMI